MAKNQAPPKRGRGYGNSDEISKEESALLETPVGRERDAGATELGAAFQEGLTRSPGMNGGSGDRETVDGLDETEESIRQAAEDVPTGGRP